jgi:predicted transcriptional regulator
MNNKKQVIFEVDEKLRDAVKNLADEFDVSMKELIKRALIDLLKKHNKEIPVKEL